MDISDTGMDGTVVAEDSLDMEPMAQDTDTVIDGMSPAVEWRVERSWFRAVRIVTMFVRAVQTIN